MLIEHDCAYRMKTAIICCDDWPLIADYKRLLHICKYVPSSLLCRLAAAALGQRYSSSSRLRVYCGLRSKQATLAYCSIWWKKVVHNIDCRKFCYGKVVMSQECDDSKGNHRTCQIAQIT